ncbi:uncharacterized protein [Mytilus edulis]|uniref:uncharacterized protein n=1 Tax=Mytilus edulis TaxID=6550 RepID=UPI0039F0B232
MAANRPRRHTREIPILFHDNDKWSLIEKRRYQRALLKHSPLEFGKISKCVQTKSAKEVKAYLELMEKRVKKKADERPKEATEMWGTLASDLVSCELKDYSEALSQVMAVAGNLENPFPPDSPDAPDYSSIYRYLSAILAGADLPYLGYLECSIVQDLLHGLVDTIRTSDTSKQQEIMINKYHLLTSKIDINNTMANVKRCRKAVNNDFSDFEKAENALYRSKSPILIDESLPAPRKPKSPKLIDESLPVNKKQKEESTPVNKRKRGRPTKRTSTSSETVPADKGPDELSTRQNTESNKTDKISETTAKKIVRKDSSHLPGPSGDCSDTETQTNIAKSGQSPKTTTVHPEGDSSKSTQPSTSQNHPGPSGDTTFSSSAANENGQDEVDGNQTEDIPKKPSLFTLNPYCIPIDLIRFNPLVSATVVFNPVKKNTTPIPAIVPKTNRNVKQQKDGEVDVICMNQRKDIIGRERFISITRTSMNDDN